MLCTPWEISPIWYMYLQPKFKSVCNVCLLYIQPYNVDDFESLASMPIYILCVNLFTAQGLFGNDLKEISGLYMI